MQKSNREIIKTVCGICFDNCGMEVEKQGADIIAIRGIKEHPFSKGNLCIKGLNAKDIALSPQRLKTPLRKVNGEFKEITWDEALDQICRMLAKVNDRHGKESLSVYFGDPIIFQGMAMYLVKLFCQIYGTPNLSCTGSLCNISKVFANITTFGRWSAPHFEKSQYIVLWGTNPLVSSVRGKIKLLEAKARGAKIVVIDPRGTQSAGIANLHLRIKPGTDGALAAGLLKVIIDEGLYDQDFLDKYTVGFNNLSESLSDLDLAAIEKITGINSASITTLAREFAGSASACIDQGSALEQHTNGSQNVRAVAALLAVTGNIDKEGGNIFPAPPPTSQPKAKSPAAGPQPAAGSKEHPLFTNFFRQGQAMTFPELLARKDPRSIRALIVTGGNMAMTWPDSQKTKQFLAGLDLLVTMDTVMSTTARLSHIVLPAAGFLERTELSLQQPLSLQKKVIQVGQARPDWEIWHGLLQHMGAQDKLPWQNEKDGITYLLKPTGKTYDDLLAGALGPEFYTPLIGGCLAKGFPTKSGKIELSSDLLGSSGYQATPVYTRPSEMPDDHYPFILTTGGRLACFNHSQFRDIPALRRAAPEPFFEINAEDAGRLSIKNDDICTVASPRGMIALKAKVTAKIIPGVIHVSHGWQEANINLLTDITVRDPISGFPSLKSLACRVEKK